MKRLLTFTLIFLLLVLPLTACSEKTELQDGYYTAQAKDFSHGWKEYIEGRKYRLCRIQR